MYLSFLLDKDVRGCLLLHTCLRFFLRRKAENIKQFKTCSEVANKFN
jgi:hypothetical protein